MIVPNPNATRSGHAEPAAERFASGSSACDASAASASGWRDRLSSYLQVQANPPHKYGHQPRLYALTCQIADGLSPKPAYDDDAVYAAAFLHDLGVFIGHRPEDPAALCAWDHVAYTCARAPEILSTLGFPREKVPLVLDCIRQHQPQDDPASFEAALLRDADILEQLGAVGILRTAAKLGSDTRFQFFTQARNSLQQALANLPPKLRLASSQELAAPRIALLHRFLQSLDAEAGQHLD